MSNESVNGFCSIFLQHRIWLISSGSCGMLQAQQFLLIKESLLWANRGVSALVTQKSSWW